MKKIYQFFKGIVKGILGNLDYVGTFILGAVAYKFAPEQLEAIKDGILTFDYGTAWASTKMFAMDSYMWIKGIALDAVALFQDAPVEEVVQ